MALETDLSLEECLAQELPKDYQFVVHHLSTPATESPPIFAAPPGHLPEKTRRESHFLSISIDRLGQQLQVFAIEVLLYTTDDLTTLFVSKADSTGYLHLLQLPKGTRSPLRAVSSTFLKWLIGRSLSPHRRIVLSLFARAQNQYLFPGSIENPQKHVLDDRGLIKWWCKVVDPLLGQDQATSEPFNGISREARHEGDRFSRQGYLRVPGYDTYSTRALFPKQIQSQGIQRSRWEVADPLASLQSSSNLPERCMIPRFPDDPKARFLIDLDDELTPEERNDASLEDTAPPSSQSLGNGRWRSVRSLDQFWEMMSFRQECSAGRLVGFLWAVFSSKELDMARMKEKTSAPHSVGAPEGLPTPLNFQHTENLPQSPSSPLRPSPIPVRELGVAPSEKYATPQAAGGDSLRPVVSGNLPSEFGQTSATAAAEVVLQLDQYEQAGDFLLQQDFANEDSALKSTANWTAYIAKAAQVQSWGKPLVGRKLVESSSPSVISTSNPTLLNVGIVRKKKRSSSDDPQADSTSGVNNLSSGLVRKKVKPNQVTDQPQTNDIA